MEKGKYVFRKIDIKYLETHSGATPKYCPPAICLACSHFGRTSLTCPFGEMSATRGRWNCVLDPETFLSDFCRRFQPTARTRQIKSLDIA